MTIKDFLDLLKHKISRILKIKVEGAKKTIFKRDQITQIYGEYTD